MIVQRILIANIKLYQKTFSAGRGFFRPFARPECVFYPSCSDYAIAVIQKYGVFKGLYKTIKRVFRCHPWQTEHIDLP